jgi:uncharacterized protein HemY
VRLLEGLAAEQPDDVRYERALAQAHWTMGNWTFSFKRHAQAKEEFHRALQAYRRACRYDHDGRIHDGLARLLCDCQVAELRDSSEAVASAKQSLARAPDERSYWSTLGLAHYRAGDYSSAHAALQKSITLSNGGDARDWLVLAMIAWKKGQPKESRSWYDQSARWLQTHGPTDELHHLRKEASEMMNIRWPPES